MTTSRCTVRIAAAFGAGLATLGLAATEATAAGSACLAAPALPVEGSRIVEVSSVAALESAVSSAQPGDTILVADGTYALTSTLYVNGVDDVTIRGTSGCDGVVLVGRGMENPDYAGVPHGVWSNSARTTVAHLTIRDVWYHPIAVNPGAQAPRVYQTKLLDAGEQFIKVSSASPAVDDGIVEFTVMEYTVGPPALDHGGGTGYTNGVDVHGGARWVVRDNLFKNFHTPDGADHRWNPAVLMWNGARDTLVERNVFIDTDRAIALGLVDRAGSDHSGGVVRNNVVWLTPGLLSPARRADSDGQIIVWDSPGTSVDHNTIITNGNVVKSIEFRFDTDGARARNNLADAPIAARGGAPFSQSGNMTAATPDLFVDAAGGDLHLAEGAAVIDQVPAVDTVPTDLDGEPRPSGAAADVGADEYAVSAPPPPEHLTALHAVLRFLLGDSR